MNPDWKIDTPRHDGSWFNRNDPIFISGGKTYKLLKYNMKFEERENLSKTMENSGYRVVQLVFDSVFPNSVWIRKRDEDEED